MAAGRAIEIMYQNQMQFNLDVPLAASNLASRYNKPCPIMVERVGGQHAIPGRRPVKQPSPENPNVSAASSFSYSMLSEDRMARASQLAKRDLKNRRLQMERSQEKSPSAESIVATRQHQPRACNRQRRPPGNKPRTPLRARESEKNRRLGNVQTPPRTSKPPPNQTLDDSVYCNAGGGEGTRDPDSFFPVKPTVPPNASAGPKDELGKLQQEMESYLQMLCRIEQQVLRDGSPEFLQRRVKGRAKENFLVEDEDLDRVRVRAGEHNTRSTRNLYNLGQKVKQLQRDITQADLSKPTKKSQLSAQLNATYRGAVRALQVFVNQLPYQDLHMGLPSTYNELALLLRQLTTMMTLTQQGSIVEGPDNVLTLLDQVDDFNSRWCSMALQANRTTQPFQGKGASDARDWVSDTKVDANIFSKNVTEFTARKPGPKKSAGGGSRPWTHHHHHPQTKRNRGGGKVGKENRWAVSKEGSMASLKSSKTALAGQKIFGFVPVESRSGPSNKSVTREIDVSKGYMLPPNLVAKREKAQRAVELSNKNFAESTQSSRLKTSSPTRPSSAPSPGRKKEVNFDLKEDRKSPLPWIPAGCSPYKPRPRSSSAERIPFFVRTLDGQDIREIMPERHARSVTIQHKQREPEFGFRSLPTDRQLKSCDISESLIDLLEKRILDRMLERKMEAGGAQPRKDQMLYRSNEALDITDLTTDASYIDDSLNTTAEAASLMDAPTLENIRLKLAGMERTRREIRQRWSSLKFTDTRPKSRHVINDCPEPPPAIDLSRMTMSKMTNNNSTHHTREGPPHPINKDWSEEPLLFTKPKSKGTLRYVLPTTDTHSIHLHGKQQVTLNQGTVDRILEDRSRFEEHLRKRSHHPSGRFDPWSLVEEISEEILGECLQEVSEEVEKISEEMASQLYKSEFMVTGRPSETRVLDLSPEPEQNQFEPAFMTEMAAEEVEKFGGNDLMLGQMDDLMNGQSPRSQMSGEESARGAGFEPFHGTASEPLLDNVSQLVQEKVEGLVEEKVDKWEDEKNDEEEEDDDEDEDDDEEDDEDEDDYSDDEFENVSDVEL